MNTPLTPLLALAAALALAACAPSAPERPSEAIAPPATTPEVGVPQTGDVRPAQAEMVGQYSGTVAPGVDTRLTLSADGSYQLEESGGAGGGTSQGQWTMTPDGQIALAPEHEDAPPHIYRVDDANTLRHVREGDLEPGADTILRRN